jgi:hypothetical protein
MNRINAHSDSIPETCLFFKGKNNKNNSKRSQLKRINADSDSILETYLFFKGKTNKNNNKPTNEKG